MGNPHPVPLTDEARARGRETQARNREARQLEQQRELEQRDAKRIAFDRLVAVANSEDHEQALAAARDILDRLYGKPGPVTDAADQGPATIVFRFESAFSVPMDATVIDGAEGEIVDELPPPPDP
jgi:hypothetical protein